MPNPIVNWPTPGGGFRHFSGLLPCSSLLGDPHHASVRTFHVPIANTQAIFRGDIVVWADAAHPTQGAADMPYNVAAPVPAPSVANPGFGGTGLGNSSMAPNVARWTPGDTTSSIAGVVVGFGPITLFMAKNGFQYIPAGMEAWVSVDTDPDLEMYATFPAVPATAFRLQLGSNIDVITDLTKQSVKFGISGLSLDAATIALTPTLPLRVLNSTFQIGNIPEVSGFVARVTFNRNRHLRGNAGPVAD